MADYLSCLLSNRASGKSELLVVSGKTVIEVNHKVKMTTINDTLAFVNVTVVQEMYQQHAIFLTLRFFF